MKQLLIRWVANEGHATEMGGSLPGIRLSDEDAAVVEQFVGILDRVDCEPGDGDADLAEEIKARLPLIRLFGREIRAKVSVPIHLSMAIEEADDGLSTD